MGMLQRHQLQKFQEYLSGIDHPPEIDDSFRWNLPNSYLLFTCSELMHSQNYIYKGEHFKQRVHNLQKWIPWHVSKHCLRENKIEEGNKHHNRNWKRFFKTILQFWFFFLANNFLCISLTCIPPTSELRPTLSKGPTAGFAPMPIITCMTKSNIVHWTCPYCMMLKDYLQHIT